MIRFVLSFGASLAFAGPAPALAESYDEYLARLRDICEVDCMQPRELLRTARRRDADEERDMAAILDIAHVSRSGDNFLLHTAGPRQSDFFDFQQFDFGVPSFDAPPLGNPNDILVELDKETLFAIFNVPFSDKDNASARSGAETDEDADIVVEGTPDQQVERPSVSDLANLFRNRRIVVRGQPRLVPSLRGARRDFRRKQLTLVLDNADDLALLPRYDYEGNPVLEGPLAGFAEPRTGE